MVKRRRSSFGSSGVPGGTPSDLRSPTVTALVVAGIYVVVAGLWLGFSDDIFLAVAPSAQIYAGLQALAPWAFALVTGLVLFLALRWEMGRRARSVEALQENLEIVTDHLGNLPLAVVEWDRNFQVSHWSRGATSLFGWTPEEALGRSWADWELVHPDDRESLSRFLRNTRIDDPGGKFMVLRNHHRDGSELWCEWYTSWTRDSKGRLVSLLSLVHDITSERKAMAEAQQLNRDLELRVTRRTRELAAANRDLRAFTHSISHDLRTPVEAVVGFAETLRDRFSGDLPPDARKFLVYILAAGRQMDHLIEDLVEYAQLGTDELVLQPVDLGEMTRNAIRTLEEAFPEAGAAISPPRAAVSVPADPELLHRVLTNLLENSLKYRHPHRPARIVVNAERQSDEVSVLIRDNGPGISPENRERVFRLFERLHAEENHPGSGIGLPIVRKAMNLMGGQVSVEDHDGPGVTMRLRFPIYGRLDTLFLEPGSQDGSGDGSEGQPEMAESRAPQSMSATKADPGST